MPHLTIKSSNPTPLNKISINKLPFLLTQVTNPTSIALVHIFRSKYEHLQRCSVCTVKLDEENPKHACLAQEIGFGSPPEGRALQWLVKGATAEKRECGNYDLIAAKCF